MGYMKQLLAVGRVGVCLCSIVIHTHHVIPRATQALRQSGPSAVSRAGSHVRPLQSPSPKRYAYATLSFAPGVQITPSLLMPPTHSLCIIHSPLRANCNYVSVALPSHCRHCHAMCGLVVLCDAQVDKRLRRGSYFVLVCSVGSSDAPYVAAGVAGATPVPVTVTPRLWDGHVGWFVRVTATVATSLCVPVVPACGGCCCIGWLTRHCPLRACVCVCVCVCV
eukprot:Opistho-2@72579